MTSETAKLNIKSQVQLRDATETDIPFIFNSWLTSYQGANAVKNVPQTVYFASQHKLIENLLKKCKVTVACNISDTNQIYGYIVNEVIEELPVIHYVYVKQIFRKMNIATILLEHNQLSLQKPAFYTHQTYSARQITELKNSSLAYNPFIAWGII